MFDLKSFLKERNNQLALFFLFLQFLLLYRNFLFESQLNLFYYCNHLPILLSIFFFYKKYDYIKALISFGFIPQLFWNIDIILNLFGITDLDFIGDLFLFEIEHMIITILIHLIVFIALYFVYKFETNSKTLLYSFYYIILIYIIVLLFVSPDEADVNCIYDACYLEFLYFDLYTYFWIPIAFITMVLPGYYLQRFLSKKFRN